MSRSVPASGSFLMHSSNHGVAPGLMHGTDGGGVGGGRLLESYGYSGFPGNSMQAAGLFETRTAALLNIPVVSLAQGTPAWGHPPSPNSLPVMDNPASTHRLGQKPRAAVAVFELISTVSVTSAAGAVELTAGAASLVRMSRPSRAYFENQLGLVESRAAQRDRRYTEILTQVAPPLAYYASIVNLQADRHPHTLLLLNTALDFTYAVAARFKHALACPRPSEYSAFIQPMIEVPLHPSFPAGHAVEGHVLAGLLTRMVAASGRTDATTGLALRRSAARIADNRVVAGLHFPIDLVAGRLLGDALAGYLATLCGAHTAWTGATFDGASLDPAAAAEGVVQPDQLAFSDIGCAAGLEQAAAPHPFLQKMWDDAVSEWPWP